MVLGLQVGQVVVVRGRRVDATGADTGVSTSEVATLDRITHARGRTTLHFLGKLAHVYLRRTLTVSANVVRATHGETTPLELLGSGEATQAHQRFTLRKSPLTYVPASSSGGGRSTAQVRVNGVRWKEVPSLYGQSPDAQVYTLRNEDDGSTTVTFGDGVHGARLPTGQDNVVATYRTGLGVGGELASGRISLLQLRPLGIKDAVNLVAATGSGEPERLADARLNAPRTVLTLDRVVSLQDYEDFARSFAGIAKAQATSLWSGEEQVAYVTVAGSGGRPVEEGSETISNLRRALIAASDSGFPVKVRSYAQRFFKLEARLLVDPAHELAQVHAAATEALKVAFSFEARGFGQPVTEAEVLHVLQSVRGVVAVVLLALHDAAAAQELKSVLPSSLARWDPASQSVLPAELLLLHPAGLKLTEVNP
jgi:predicted phage baseplate assembly protein